MQIVAGQGRRRGHRVGIDERLMVGRGYGNGLRGAGSVVESEQRAVRLAHSQLSRGVEGQVE